MPAAEWSSTSGWTKICVRCKKTYRVQAKGWENAYTAFREHFSTNYISRMADNLDARCHDCKSQIREEQRTKSITGYTNRHKHLNAQNYKCQLCENNLSVNDACIDHDHKTNRFRGMLCLYCNTRMAVIDDDEWLAKAIAYRDRHRK